MMIYFERITENRLLILYTSLHERKRKGIPKAQWLNQVETDLKLLHVNKGRKQATKRLECTYARAHTYAIEKLD